MRNVSHVPYCNKKMFVGAEPTPILWQLGVIDAYTEYGFRRTKARILGDLCVHRMLDCEGYAISITSLGFWFSSRGRVFRTERWACMVAEKLQPLSNGWVNYMEWEMPTALESKITYIHDVAELHGAFFKWCIDPADAVHDKYVKDELEHEG